jgi:hypothetical protein
MARATAQHQLRLRLIVVEPAPGVTICVQQGRCDLLSPSRANAREAVFDFDVRVGARPNGAPNFLGDFAQGPADGRFLYLNAGVLAGQSDACWQRRAKIPLTGITWQQIEDAVKRQRPLEARIQGRGRKGDPVCASVPLLGGGWQLANEP